MKCKEALALSIVQHQPCTCSSSSVMPLKSCTPCHLPRLALDFPRSSVLWEGTPLSSGNWLEVSGQAGT